jgi:hypothetical protein
MEGFEQETRHRPLLLVNDYAQRRVRRRPSGDLPAFYELYGPAPFNPHSVVKGLLVYVRRLPLVLWRFIRFCPAREGRSGEPALPGPATIRPVWRPPGTLFGKLRFCLQRARYKRAQTVLGKPACVAF